MSRSSLSRARRVLGVLGSVVGVTVTFVVGLAGAAVLHLDAPAVRRIVVSQANGILASTLKGQVHIDSIGHLGLDGVDGVRVHIEDPDGVRVLAVDGVRVRVRGVEAVRSALFGKGPIVIEVPEVAIHDVEANLDTDGTNARNLRLANTFVFRNPTPTGPNAPPGRGVRVEAPHVRLTHGWAHGYPPGGQPVDADLHNLSGRAHVDPQRVDAFVTKLAIDARAMPRGADPRGVVNGRFSMPLAGDKPPMVIEAAFDGRIGNIPTTVKGAMNGSRVDATVDAHDATGSDAATMVSEVTIRDALTLHAEAHGDLPHIDAKANLALGHATVDASAGITTGPTTRIEGEVAVRHVDASKLQKGAPKTELGLDVTGDVSFEASGVKGTISGDTSKGYVGEMTVPPIAVRGTFDRNAAHAVVKVPDPSLATTVEVRVTPHGEKAQTIVATVTSRIPDLHKVPVVGAEVGGSASLDATATLEMPTKAIAGKAKVDVSRVRDHQLALGVAQVEADASGTLDRPVVDAQLHAKDLLTGTLPFAKLDAKAHVVGDGSEVAISNVRAEATRLASESIVASVHNVSIGGSNLRVDGAVVTGLGEPIHADIAKSGNDLDGTIDAPGINLRLASRVVGKEDELGIQTGTLAIGAKGGLHGKDVKAGLHAELRDFTSKDVKNAKATIDAKVNGKDVDIEALANVGSAGAVRVTTNHLVLAGPAADPNSWQRAHGKLSLDGDIDLSKVASLVPEATLPVSKLEGELIVQGRFGRDSENSPPEVQIHGYTRGLVVAGQAEQLEPLDNKTKVQTAPPWTSTGIDIGFDIGNDATSGLTGLAFRATDQHGIIVALDSKTILPYGELIADPKDAKAKVMKAPISARMVIPPRRLDQLPPIIGLKDMNGAIEGDLEAGGTILDPHVRFIAKARGIRAPQMPKNASADTDLALDYDGRQAKVAIKSASNGRDLLVASAELNAKSRDFLLGNQPQWTGSARAHLAEFPLESVPQIAQQRVKGSLTGDLALEDFHHDAKATAHIALSKLKVGKVEYEKAVIDAEAGRGKLAAKVRIDDKGSFIDAFAASGMDWGAATAPALSKTTPLEAKLEAKDFHAAAIQPFVSSVIPTLDGKINASAHAVVTPGKPGAELDGKVVFSEGTVQPAALGEELRNVRATVSLSKDGTIKVDDVSAQGIQGEIHANALAKLDGFRLADATANVDIPKHKAFDFALQGQPLGTVYGSVKIKASQSADGKVTTVAIEVPSMNVELPQALKTGVEPLDKKDNIRIGVYSTADGASPTFVNLPLDKQDTLPPPEKRADDPSRLDLDVKLGRIEVARGNQARVGLAGNLKVSVGLDTRITGEIHALDGWADVQGKKFTVEKATVTFEGLPEPNPVVLATATWTAADGTKVFADFIGPVKTGKVILRSEPARPQNEVLALVLFGSADGANPTPSAPESNSQSTTKTAVGVGGGVAAQGLTNALDDMAGIQATVRIDTTSSTNPRPEVEFQVSPKVAIAFGHVLGTPPITEPDTNLAKVEYRFHYNWSLEGTAGDKGKGTLDAVWQKRY
jgi:translocation and assembly module TamB